MMFDGLGHSDEVFEYLPARRMVRIMTLGMELDPVKQTLCMAHGFYRHIG